MVISEFCLPYCSSFINNGIEDELMNYILQEPVEIGQRIPNEFELAEKFGVGDCRINQREQCFHDTIFTAFGNTGVKRDILWNMVFSGKVHLLCAARW